jgi:DNA-binding XRE family transcriptional regulator
MYALEHLKPGASASALLLPYRTIDSTFGVRVPWHQIHQEGIIMRVPNLSPHRQDPALVALGAALKRARLKAGKSQDELAYEAEIDRSHVGRVERGDNNVAMLTLLRLCKVLGISLAALMKDAGL